jgi:DNA polymerase sigma
VKDLDSLLGRRFPDSSLEVYGSCLSGLSLGKSSDVDISLQLRHIAEAEQELADGNMSADKYEKLLRKACYMIHGILKNKDKQGFVKLECITRARVPVVKGVFKHAGNPYSTDGSIQ